MRKKKISISNFGEKEKKFTFEEKQKLIYGFESFGANLIEQSALFLFGNSDKWALSNIRKTLVNIVFMAFVFMASERYGITTDYAKKEREEFLKRIGIFEQKLKEKEGGEND